MNTTFTRLPISTTGQFDSILVDYISHTASLKKLYHFSPTIEGVLESAGARTSFPVDRNTLMTVLMEQNQAADNAVKENIHLLKQENVFTITTGHQLNLFTGPLYVVFKILSVIKLCGQLNGQQAGFRFVPVYWMASEDHDFAEINHLTLYSKKLEWKTSQQGACGRFLCTGLEEVFREVENILGTESAEVMHLLRSVYTTDKTLAAATRQLVNTLFGKYGLVVIDGDDHRLKQQFAPHIENELIHQIGADKVHHANETIAGLGYKAQAHEREINLFYLADKLRERIVKTNDGFDVLNTGTRFTREEMQAELQRHPERFSPNVILRPLYEQCVLPDVAYIGGPAEVAYWLQLKALHDSAGVFFPAVLMRNSLLLYDNPSLQKLEQAGMNPAMLFLPEDELIRGYVQQHGESFDTGEEKMALKRLFEKLKTKAGTVDQTLQQAADADLARAMQLIEHLEQKVFRAQKRKQETGIARIRKLKEKFFPGGAMMERSENFLPYYVKYGPAFFDRLLQVLEPVAQSVILLNTDQQE